MAATKGSGGGKVRNKRPQTKTAVGKAAPAPRAIARASSNASFKRPAGPVNPQTGRTQAKGAVASQQGAKVRADQLARLRQPSAPAPQPGPFDGIGRAIGDFFGSRNREITGQTESTISRAMKAGPQSREAIRRATGGR